MTDNLPARIQNLIDKINQAIEQVENGDLIDLGEMDDEVAAVCEAAQEPAVEEMEEVDEKMDEMIARLEELSEVLDSFDHGNDNDDRE
jgi:methyl-accepting chemotaxis protein